MRFQAGDGIDPACGEEDHAGPAFPAGFQAVVGPDEVCLNQVVGGAILPGEDGWLGGTLDHEIERNFWKTPGLADISPVEIDACGFETGDVEFRPAPVKVVHTEDAGAGHLAPQGKGEVGSDEPGSAGDEKSRGSRVEGRGHGREGGTPAR